MFGRKHETGTNVPSDADLAVQKSWEDYEAVQALKPAVEETVRGHLTLQKENHFAERMWLAYRGEWSR